VTIWSDCPAHADLHPQDAEANCCLPPRADVWLAAGTRHTHIHTNTYARVGEHHGEGGYTRPTGANKFSTTLNNLINREGSGGATLEAGKANDEEEGQTAGGTRAVAQGEEEPERRLCGG
jgi:hypothetical protein